ncbi:MAG TPA: hypothetical protein VNW99_10660 [Cytophagaceae bacterium]|nr:hypothetical protein [Cytophagaceae bacterium]
MRNTIKRSTFFTKILQWEFWPFTLFYFPILLYWLWLSIKARSFFFFSASNPSIETGGMMGESKIRILEQIPEAYLPKTFFVKAGEDITALNRKLISFNISYPLIAKPDVGERGRMVEKIKNAQEMESYLRLIRVDFIVQEFIGYPLELGIFYVRYPDETTGKVTSIVIKDFLKVIGDGQSTILELMKNYPRAAFQLARLGPKLGGLAEHIPATGEVVDLEPIGNHARGTTFLNGNDLIDQHLNEVFDSISKQIPGFYYGRYDLKCTSIEDLKLGKNIKIMELNGAGAEPAHIYHPHSSLLLAYKALFSHWRMLYEVSKQNHKHGIPYMSFSEARKKYKEVKEYQKVLLNNG